MSAHTPGPWNLETVNTACGICHKIGPMPSMRDGGKPGHACLYVDYPTPGHPVANELAANARLIAAAPDLLDALEGTHQFLKSMSETYESLGFALENIAPLLAQSQSAIAKVRGTA